MRLLAAVVLALAVVPLGGCATTGSAHPEASPYSASADASAQVAEARRKAAAENRPLLIVLGANWCHDSRALAGWLETPRFRQLVAERFELVFVDVGHPQDGEGRNLEIAREFGIETLTSTPAVLVVSPGGELLNRDSATKWGNAASRSEDAIFDELARFAAVS